MSQQTAIIIGAGPAGLTAAYELLRQTDIQPIVLEQSEYIGGISRTVNYKGNRIDIGGHRFFSKSDRVMNWWLDVLPIEQHGNGDFAITYQGKSRPAPAANDGVDPKTDDRVMLVRNRKSRIYFLRQLFEYPIRLSVDTLSKLGAIRTGRIGLSYARAMVKPITPERSLEDFFINRFGRELYKTFFKDYTEKVWGVPCREISAEWGAQRVKGLSVIATLKHALKSLRRSSTSDVAQKTTETSLIERFLYPKFGPGQMWEEVARRVCKQGGRIVPRVRVTGLRMRDGRIVEVEAQHIDTGASMSFTGDFFFSTMPIKELVAALDAPVPANVREVANGLAYRDFMTVGLLLKRMKLRDDTDAGARFVKDNWIYIQEPDVLVGRLQIFNNWSPYMVADPDTVWVGLEYFCYENDDLWRKPDDDMIALAVDEMKRLGIIDDDAVMDATVIRMPKTYPAYFGAYARFDEVRSYIDQIPNLFLIGRNGMHRYNNQDHSMLTAMVAVEMIKAGSIDKSAIWAVNTEQEYHESK